MGRILEFWEHGKNIMGRIMVFGGVAKLASVASERANGKNIMGRILWVAYYGKNYGFW